jgi:hypothetical protein
LASALAARSPCDAQPIAALRWLAGSIIRVVLLGGDHDERATVQLAGCLGGGNLQGEQPVRRIPRNRATAVLIRDLRGNIVGNIQPVRCVHNVRFGVPSRTL